jgi:alpha-L-fucosidase 2
MVFGNVAVETFQLNEDTVWAGGAVDQRNPNGASAIGRIRQLVFEKNEDSWVKAQNLINSKWPAGRAGSSRINPSETSFSR